jgi:hypothetical protein
MWAPTATASRNVASNIGPHAGGSHAASTAMAPRNAAVKGRGNGLASCKESEPGSDKLPWLRGSALQHAAKRPTAPSRRHRRSYRRHRLCRRPPSAQSRRATRASGEASWPSAQSQPSAQVKRRRQDAAVGTNGRRHSRQWVPLGLTDGPSYADGNAVGTALIEFFARKFPAALFLLVRAQNLGPTCADGIAVGTAPTLWHTPGLCRRQCRRHRLRPVFFFGSTSSIY